MDEPNPTNKGGEPSGLPEGRRGISNPAPGSWSAGTIAVCILAALALAYTSKIIKPVLLPILLAMLFNFLLRPVFQILLRAFRSPILAALVIMLVLAGAFLVAVYYLSNPAAQWIERLPETLRKFQYRMDDLTKPVTRVSEIANKVGEFAGGDAQPEADKMEVRKEKVSDTMWAHFQVLVNYTVLTLILLFFALAYGGVLRDKLKVYKQPMEIVDEISDNISSYLFTVTIINTSLGLAVALAMYLAGMPNPLLWGAMCGLFNYVPYLGAMVGTIIVAIVALLSFSNTGQIILIPALYYGLTVIEGNFVTPMVLGHRFTLNPLFILIGLILFGWMWGVPGALVAVPLLMAIKITFEHIEPFKPIGELMSM